MIVKKYKEEYKVMKKLLRFRISRTLLMNNEMKTLIVSMNSCFTKVALITKSKLSPLLGTAHFTPNGT